MVIQHRGDGRRTDVRRVRTAEIMLLFCFQCSLGRYHEVQLGNWGTMPFQSGELQKWSAT